MAKYRKKPVVIEAIQFDGYNYPDIISFGNGTIQHFVTETDDIIFIPTLEGELRVSVNDWVIEGVNGEFYPCKPDIFEKTYELVREEKHEGLY